MKFGVVNAFNLFFEYLPFLVMSFPAVLGILTGPRSAFKLILKTTTIN
jgi:hypothetical protein